VSDENPIYTGISGWHFSILNPQEHHPDLYSLVNRGSLFAFSSAKALIAQQMGDGSIGATQWNVLPEDWQKDVKYDIQNSEAVRNALLEEHQDWAPELRKIIEVMDMSHVLPRNLYMLPIGHKWTHKPGVTLLGDAAHLMSPFAGEGVNLAMKDALDLSEAIIEATKSGDKASLDEQVRKFEDTMFKRSTRVQQQTYAMMSNMFFSRGAPDTTIEKWVCEAVTSEMNPILGVPISALVYVYYFFFRLFGWGGGHK
jgi:2-polyprenyl-6-methoxyphenol hydroxylase-like FAD-dependent oxidoreductase